MSGYSEPIVLSAMEVSESDSMTGLWKGVHGYYHDCYGCETRNRIWLSVGNGYTVVMTEAIDVFTQLFHVPIIDKTFGNPEPWRVNTTNFDILGNCLVEVTPEPVIIDDSTSANETVYSQELEADSSLTCDFKFERKGDKLILTP